MEHFENKRIILERKLRRHFQINSELENGISFQSCLPLKNEKVLENIIIEQIMDLLHIEPVAFWITYCFARMINIEKTLYQSQYAVFYRIVGDQYIGYELYSLLMTLLKKTPHGEQEALLDMMIRDKKALKYPFICTNSILEKTYKNKKIDDFIQKLDVVDKSDMGEDMAPLLAAHCSLIPYSGASVFAYNFESDKETGSFWAGYETSFDLETVVKNVLKHVFDVDDETSSKEFTSLIQEAYNSEQLSAQIYEDSVYDFRGHMIQICIPLKFVDSFAFASAAYGYKVDTVITEKNGRSQLRGEISKKNDKTKRKKHIPTQNITRYLSFAELLKTKELDKVQSRIMGHPDLYVKHGAFCHVYSGLEHFNQSRFRLKLVFILEPLLRKLINEHEDVVDLRDNVQSLF